jgi:segregation and condensation protein A
MDTLNTNTSYKFRVREFEGPLDLLLFLIKKNEVNIYDIPIAQITEQYLDYLKFSIELDLEDLSEFHSLATSLLYIKSRMLLPPDPLIDDDMEDPRQELVEKLIEYQKFKKLSELMEEKEREAEWVVERKKLQRPLPFTDKDLWEKIDVWDLLRTFTNLMSRLSGEQIIDLNEEVSVNEKITLLSELLERRGECNFTDLVVRGTMLDVICAFLAILEAVKMRMVTIFQNRMFGDILIRSNEDQADGDLIGKRNGLD